MPGRTAKVFTAPPLLELEESFSFGSFDEEEEENKDNALVTNKKNSFRLNIRKSAKDSESIDRRAAYDRMNSMPLTRREKLRSSSTLDTSGNATKVSFDPSIDPKLNRLEVLKENDSLYSNSWRANNISSRSIQSSPGAVQREAVDAIERVQLQRKSSRDDENASGPGRMPNNFDRASAIFSVQTVTSAAVEVRLSEKELRKHFESTVLAAEVGEWYVVASNISSYGKKLVGYQSSKYEKKNLFHIIASQQSVPVKVFEMMMNHEPEALRRSDKHGCVPLHYAASVGRCESSVTFLLNQWAFGSSSRNVDGDLPLHVAVWSGTGNENIARAILTAYPSALIAGNDVGGTPLHLASCGEDASPEIVQMLLEKHEELDYPIESLDIGKNAPIHIAVKTNAPVGVLRAFKTVFGESPFHLVDRENKTPLQVCLLMKNINAGAVCYIAENVRKAAKIQMPEGFTPCIYAASRNLPPNVVKHLLLCDMPIILGGRSQGKVNDVILRTHSYSWWNIATKFPQYSHVMSDILKNHANLQEIAALAQETDPEGSGCLYEAVTADVRKVFKSNLVFGERYEVIAMYRAIVRGGLVKVCALDWGERIAWEEIAASKGGTPQQLEDGYTSVNSAGNGTEVVYYTKPQREVVLYCCLVDSESYKDLMEEMNARKKFNYSHLDSQRLYNVHTFDAKIIGCKGRMLCLSFERPLLTLQDVFETSRYRKRKNLQWGRKSWNLLKRLAQVLQYFHSAGYIHGYVDSNTIAKFDGSNNWKLLDMRRTTLIGEQMSGDIRSCVPPESISASLSMSPSSDKLKSISFDEDFQKTKTINYSVSFDEEKPGIYFAPELCVAEPSWDIWSFGIVMGQLILGQSAVLLPNFEVASDAHMKNLYQYDHDVLTRIKNVALRVSGKKAAKLLVKCLQPESDERPSSMAKILNDPYFDDINKIGY